MTKSFFLRSLLFLTALLFIGANLLFAWAYPLEALGGVSAYNALFHGRERLPYGDRPDLAYNLTLDNLPAMFASHVWSAPAPQAEFRVALIGDSAAWGYLLRPHETLSALLNAQRLTTADGRPLRFYNAGYPTLSLMKDLLMLEAALEYQPDLVIWRTTLEAFPIEKQLASPIAANNPERGRGLIAAHNLPLDASDPQFAELSAGDRSLIGARRPLADLIRLQVYGVLWAATGIDQYYPDTYDPPQSDLDAEEAYYGNQPPNLPAESLAWEMLTAGVEMAGVPILIVNEPIYISQGENSDVRYNFFYPRWAFDAYRLQLADWCTENGVACLDAWDLVPPEEFTNSAIHLSAAGERLLAEQVQSILKEQFFVR